MSSCCWNLEKIPSHLQISSSHTPTHRVFNVVLIVLDGVRREEFFQGPRDSIKKNTKNKDALNSEERKSNPQKARRKLFPFLWGNLATKKGTIIVGDTNSCQISNPFGISLPGYSDIFAGRRQCNVKTNQFHSKPFCPTIPDLLIKEGMHPKQIAVFASWKHIENVASKYYRDSIVIHTGPKNPPLPRWKHSSFDKELQKNLRTYLNHTKDPPRYLSVIFNDTDEWAHLASYSNYIQAIQSQDSYIQEIYKLLESKKKYHQKTVYIITSDHGRGEGEKWTRHGKVKGAKKIWSVLSIPSLIGISSDQIKWIKDRLREDCNHHTIGKIAYWILSRKK